VTPITMIRRNSRTTSETRAYTEEKAIPAGELTEAQRLVSPESWN
jgi:hypothetical protein